jgi:ABC-type amino acid transport substrate-binding protein
VRLALLLLLIASPLHAQSAADSALTGRVLTAAVHHAPPFAIQHSDGTWEGAAVELWRAMGRQAGFEARLMPVAADTLLASALGQGADVALTATVRQADLERVDYLPAYYASALGVAKAREGAFVRVIGNLFTPTFARIVGGLSLLLLLVGAAVWALEKRQNDDEFRSSAVGIWDGFWWAGVTMTTIGYGDKAPRTVAGRLLALLWMLLSMGVTAALTTALISALGIGGSDSSASLPGDLDGQRTGVIAGSFAAELLEAEGLGVRPYADLETGLDALALDSLDAFVGALPVVRAQLKARGLSDDFSAAPVASVSERWALAVPRGSPLRLALAHALLERTESPSWRATLDRYLEQ